MKELLLILVTLAAFVFGYYVMRKIGEHME